MYGAKHSEIGLMKRAGHAYGHIPQTHLQSPLFLEMLFAGVPCGIAPGTVNRRMPRDMLLAGRRAMLEEITAQDDYHYLPSGKVLELMTAEAAAALDVSRECGSIEVGKRADMNLLCWRRAHLTPNFMPVQVAVQRAYGQDIRLVLSEGRLVKDTQGAGCGKGE